MPETPESIKPFEDHFQPDAWTQYELSELGWWVYLLVRRALMRVPGEKRDRDLQSAQHYLDMMQSKLHEVRNS